MSKRLAALVLGLAWVCVLRVPSTGAETLPDTLQRQTQELLDAIATGGTAVWERYLHEEVRFVDESGDVARKKEMVEAIRPFPEGISGRLVVQDYDVALHGDVAVATYIADETQDYYGHPLHCQYRSTDTWAKTPSGWQLIASQVVPKRTDPPATSLQPALHDEYCGRYALTPAITYEIRCSGDKLEGERTGRKAEELRAEAPDVLFVPGKPRYRKIFMRGPDGRVTGFADRREAWDLVWKRLP